MTSICEHRDISVALYAGGELSGEASREIQAHIQTCARCRALYEDLIADRTLLLDLGGQFDEFAPTAVRIRVMKSLWHRLAARWIAIAASVAMVIFGSLFFRDSRVAPASITANVHNGHAVPAARGEVGSSHAVELPLVAVDTPTKHKRHRARLIARAAPPRRDAEPWQRLHDTRSTASSNEQDGTLLVKLVTDDPNIVIYWIAN